MVPTLQFIHPMPTRIGSRPSTLSAAAPQTPAPGPREAVRTPPPTSSFTPGDSARAWASKKAAFERAFAKGDAARIATALQGPDALIARDAIHALLGQKPERATREALVEALLGAPQVWNHVDVHLLERHGTAAQRTQVLDTQLSVAAQKGSPSWAVYGAAKAAASGDARALEVVRGLTSEGRADARAAAASAADDVARERPADALRLLTTAGLPLSKTVAREVTAAATAGCPPPAELVSRLASRGDERAVELLERFSDRWWAQDAVRDAFRLGGEDVQRRLAPLVRDWRSGDGLETLIAGARSGAPKAIEALTSAVEFLPREQQAAPLTVLRELVQRGDASAIRAATNVRLTGLTSPEVVELAAAAALKSPRADARRVLDGIGDAVSASYRDAKELPRLLAAFGEVSAGKEANANDLRALRVATQRLSGEASNPAAALLSTAFASRGDRLTLADVKGTRGSELGLAGLMDVVRSRTEASRPELVALSDALTSFVPSRDAAQLPDAKEAARLVADAAIRSGDAVVLGGALGREAVFPLLSDAQKVAVGALASRSADLRAELTSWLPRAPETARLESLGVKFEQALTVAIGKAPEGSPLQQLGALLKATALARTDAFKDRIDMTVVNQRLGALLNSPATQQALEGVRQTVVTQAPDRQRIAAQADFLASASYQARLAALPPEVGAAEFRRDLLALKALAPDQVARVVGAQRELALEGLAQQVANAPEEQRADLELLLRELTGAGAKVVDHALESANQRLSGPGMKSVRALLFGLDLAFAARQLDGFDLNAVSGAAKLGEAVTWGANVVSGGAFKAVAAGAANVAAGVEVVIDGYGAVTDALDGDVAGAAGKGLSAGAAGTLLVLAAGGPVSWAAVLACTGVGLGGKLIDGFFGESPTETQLRQQGLLKRE